jgi:hypothetical protein
MRSGARPVVARRDLLAGRRALQRGVVADVIAVGPSILSRRTHMGIPVAVRADLRLALASGHFDVVRLRAGPPSIVPCLTSTHARGRNLLLSGTVGLPGATVAQGSAPHSHRRFFDLE